MRAILKRAETITPEDLGGKGIDLFTSFEMVEHLHNPAIFFRRIAKYSMCKKILITVPYMNNSRVGLKYIRKDKKEDTYAEDEHIFELSPEDWTLLFLHSGWKVTFSEVYYQYPRRIPFFSKYLKKYWRRVDYEGFWGAILEKDLTYTDYYKDWDDK